MLVTLDQATRHETPNAVMRRYPGTATAVWRTEMVPGATGPEHVFDVEQVVVVVEGRLRVTVQDETLVAGPGDAITLPAGLTRQLANDADGPLVAISSAPPGGTAQVGDAGGVPVPWAG